MQINSENMWGLTRQEPEARIIKHDLWTSAMGSKNFAS